MNYIDGVEILIKENGRGVFAKRDLEEEELLIVEKAVARAQYDDKRIVYSFQNKNTIHDGPHIELVNKCS